MSSARAKENYKSRIIEFIEELSPAKLRLLYDFVEYLHDREAWEETQSILSNKKLMQELEEADRDWNDGEYDKSSYTDWEEIKEEV